MHTPSHTHTLLHTYAHTHTHSFTHMHTPSHTHTTPPVLVHLGSFYSAVNSIVIINFTIQEAKPPVQSASISWRFNNGVINTSSSKYTQPVTASGSIVRLTIRSLTLVVTGHYQVFVSHEAVNSPVDVTINLQPLAS